jgi:hypothetical protein
VKSKTRPPVELTVSTLAAAEVAHYRLAHNSLAFSMLSSHNSPIVRAHSGIPNGQQRGDTRGGLEQALLADLQATADHLESQHALAAPGSPELTRYAERMLRVDAQIALTRAALDAITPPGPPPGQRNAYMVTVPALHARVAGVEYVAELWRGQVIVDAETPGLDAYLGRGQHAGHEIRGEWPLWRPYDAGMKPASSAEKWHAELLERLWPAPRLPELRVSMEIAAGV